MLLTCCQLTYLAGKCSSRCFFFCAIYLSSLLLPRPNFLRHVAAIKFNMSSNFCHNKFSQFNHLIGFLCSVKKYRFIRFANNCILFFLLHRFGGIWGAISLALLNITTANVVLYSTSYILPAKCFDVNFLVHPHSPSCSLTL